MLCNRCHYNEATRKVHTLIGGKVSVMYLCDECYEAYNSEVFQSQANYIATFFNNVKQPTMRDKVCPNCGTKLSEFYKYGYLGCERCYDQFRDEIEMQVKKIQGKTVHVGKRPKSESSGLADRQRRLIKEYEKARREARENDARSINAEINRISAKMQGKSGEGNER